MYNNFTFFMPAKILFGAGQIGNLRNKKLPEPGNSRESRMAVGKL